MNYKFKEIKLIFLVIRLSYTTESKPVYNFFFVACMFSLIFIILTRRSSFHSQLRISYIIIFIKYYYTYCIFWSYIYTFIYMHLLINIIYIMISLSTLYNTNVGEDLYTQCPLSYPFFVMYDQIFLKS